ncbi:copper resistance protein CopC [Jatrophihabitans sp.]|uniref:copper resistance CopC/CopD family protein n=1 Tax=Jatrophihabitans sp. TaxID=1932789 RepID=UPI0030C698DB|nr:Copper transport protein [Jatrophihabitans sp.]
MTRLRGRRLGALLLMLGALLGAGFALAGAASAHATVVSSDPLDGTRLKSAPASVSITYDESVGLGSLGYLHVVNGQGKRVESGAAYHPKGNGAIVAVNLPSSLPDGTYTESYRVISADSHPIAGVVRFVIGNGPLTAAVSDGTTRTSDGGVSALFDVVRWLSFAGLGLLGGAWLMLTVWPEGRDDYRARRLVWLGWGGLVVGGILEVLLEGVFAAGRSVSSLFSPSLVDATLHTHYGELHSGRLLMLGLLAVLLGAALQPGRDRQWWERAVWPLAAGIVWTFSDSGHPATTNPSWLSILNDGLHLLAMATWVGGLVMIVGVLLPRREPEELRRVLPVFSAAAFGSVVVLAVTGTYAAWRGIGSLRAIFTTEYGLLIDLKVLLFVGLLGLGNLSRLTIARRLRPRVAYAATTELLEAPAELTANETERMRRSVWVEVVVAVIVLGVTAILVSQPRGNEAIAARDRGAVSGHASIGGGRTADVRVDPGVHGSVTVGVTLSAGAVPQSLTATASNPAQQLGPIPIRLTAQGRNEYSSSVVNLPVAGTWVIDLVVTESKFDAVAADVSVKLH